MEQRRRDGLYSPLRADDTRGLVRPPWLLLLDVAGEGGRWCKLEVKHKTSAWGAATAYEDRITLYAKRSRSRNTPRDIEDLEKPGIGLPLCKVADQALDMLAVIVRSLECALAVDPKPQLSRSTLGTVPDECCAPSALQTIEQGRNETLRQRAFKPTSLAVNKSIGVAIEEAPA
jgi:hypothetical protein